jgi:hypothetical protein
VLPWEGWIVCKLMCVCNVARSEKGTLVGDGTVHKIKSKENVYDTAEFLKDDYWYSDVYIAG